MEFCYPTKSRNGTERNGTAWNVELLEKSLGGRAARALNRESARGQCVPESCCNRVGGAAVRL